MSIEPTRPTSGNANPPKQTPDPPQLEFKRLTAGCSRGAFSCGEREIDKWFRNDAYKHHLALRFRVMTAHLINNNSPVAFYALAMHLEKDSSLEKGNRSAIFSKGGYFPVLRLCYIAVLSPMQRQGIGTVVMGSVLRDFYEVAVRTGVYAFTLTALNERAAAFYDKLGFVPYGTPNPVQPNMLLPARTIIELTERNA